MKQERESKTSRMLIRHLKMLHKHLTIAFGQRKSCEEIKQFSKRIF